MNEITTNTVISTGTYEMYLTDLKDYNEGTLNGYWLDLLGKDIDEIREEITDFLMERTEETGELHEEWFITDWENLPNFGEYPDLEKVVKYVELICEHGDAFEYWYDNEGTYTDCDSWEVAFEDSYRGEYEDGLKGYAYELVDEGCYGDISDSLKPYIDYDSIARDLDCDGYWDRNGHVFCPA